MLLVADRPVRSSSASSFPNRWRCSIRRQTSLYTLLPMLAVAVDLPAVHQVAERHRPAAPPRSSATPHQAHRHIHSPEEIELLIAESRDGGLLEPDEHRRLQRALRLNLRQAKQLMVPRAQDRRRSTSTRRSTRSSASSRRARSRGCPSIATRSTTSSASCTRRISCAGSSATAATSDAGRR